MMNREKYQKIKKYSKSSTYKKDLYDVKITSLAEVMEVDADLLARIVNGLQEPEEELRLLLLSNIAGIKRERDILDAEEA